MSLVSFLSFPLDLVVGEICMFRKDENGKTNYTELIAKHGCGADIGEIEGRHHFCSEHPDSCFNVDDSTFPSANKTAVVTNIEVCFCSTDRSRS